MGCSWVPCILFYRQAACVHFVPLSLSFKHVLDGLSVVFYFSAYCLSYLNAITMVLNCNYGYDVIRKIVDKYKKMQSL